MFEQWLLVVWAAIVLVWFVSEFLVNQVLADDVRLTDEGHLALDDVIEMNEIQESCDRNVAMLGASDDDGSCSFQALHSELKQMKKMVELLLPQKNKLEMVLDHDVSDGCSTSFADDDFPRTTSSPGLFAADLLDTRLLLDRLRVLEKEKSDLVVENGNQRRQYERYLNDITSHVVHVLGAQKSLRSDCLRLQQRVQQLEEQNQRLQHLVQQTFNTLTCSSLRVLNEAATLVGMQNLNLNVELMKQTNESCNSLHSVSSTLGSSASHSFASGSWHRQNSNSSEGSKSTVKTLMPAGVPTSSLDGGLSDQRHCSTSSQNGSTSSNTTDRSAPCCLISTYTKHSDKCMAGSGEDCHANCCYLDLPGLRSSYCQLPELAGEFVGPTATGSCSTSTSYCDLEGELADRSTSPGASLLGLDDAFSSRFVIEEADCDDSSGGFRAGRLKLQNQTSRRPFETDSDSEDPCSTAGASRCGGSRNYGGVGTASTTSLNDFLDGDGCNVDGSDLTSVPDDSGGEECDGIEGGARERSLDDSDYERLVVENIQTDGPVRGDRMQSPMQQLLPRFRRRVVLQRTAIRPSQLLMRPSVLRNRYKGHWRGHTVVVNGFRRPMMMDSSEDALERLSDEDDDDESGDYTRLAEEGVAVNTPLTRIQSSRMSRSACDTTSTRDDERLYTNLPYSTSARSFRLLPELTPPENKLRSTGSMGDTAGSSARSNGAHSGNDVTNQSPSKLLLLRRKCAHALSKRPANGESSQSANFVDGKSHRNRQNGGKEDEFAAGGGGRVMFSSNSLSSSTSSYDELSSLGSREWIGCHLSDGSDTVVSDRPLASNDDGYCTARSGRPVVDTPKKGSSKKFLYSRPLNGIMSSSEDITNSARIGVACHSRRGSIVVVDRTDENDEQEKNQNNQELCDSSMLDRNLVSGDDVLLESSATGACDLDVLGTRWTSLIPRCSSDSRLTEPGCFDPYWIDGDVLGSNPDVHVEPDGLGARRNSFQRSLSDPGFLLSQSVASRQEYQCGFNYVRNEVGNSVDSSLADEMDFRRALDMFAYLDDSDLTRTNCTI